MKRAQSIMAIALAVAGLTVFMGTALAAAHLGVAATPDRANQPGVVVERVAPDSPAAKAGVKPGDVIVNLDGRPTNDMKALADMVRQHKAGDKVTLKVRRAGKEESLVATLADESAVPDNFRPEQLRRRMMERLAGPSLGVYPQTITPDLKERLNLATDKGVIVMDVIPDSPAAKAGLKRDDVITAINNQPIKTDEELREAIHKAGEGNDVTVRAMRGKQAMEVKAKLESVRLRFPGAENDGFTPPPFERPGGRLSPPEQRIQELERRIQELEKRIKELEKK